MKNFVLVLDSYGLIYKTYYAFYKNPLLTKEGKNISCVYGFFNTLNQLIEQYKPDTIIAAMDSIGPTFRHEQYPEYKANREKTPEDLHAQIPIIEEILEAMKIQKLRCNGFEADDIIATISAKHNSENASVYIFSNDKDLLQLLCTSVHIIHTDKSKQLKIYQKSDFSKEWGVSCDQILDLLALIGDSADNIRGVKGIGIKTAQKILSNYKTVDEFFANIEKDTFLTSAIKQKLIDGREDFKNARSLIKLNYEVPVNFNLEKTNFDFMAGAKKLLSAQIPSIAKKFAKLGGGEITHKDFIVAKKNRDDKSVAKILSPLQEIANKKEYSFDFKAKSVIVSDALELKQILENNSTKKTCTIYIQNTNDSKNHIAYIAFCFESEIVYIADFWKQNDLPLLKNADSASPENFNTAMETLKKFFSKDNIKFIFHDAKPAMKLLKKNSLLEDYNLNIFDTAVAAWVLDTSLNNYFIESILKIIFNLNPLELKNLQKKKKTFFEIEKQEREKYLLQNTLSSFYFYNFFEAGLTEYDLEKIYSEIELQLLPVLCEMEETGIYLSVDEINKFSSELFDEIKINEDEIFKLAGKKFNVASPKQLQTVLFEEKKLKPLKKIKTGYSTDDATLESLINDDAIIVPIMNYRKLTKLQSTYTDALTSLTDSSGRIHTTFLQTGTATGRLSSKDPNLQNIPIRDELGLKIRAAFHATEGKLLLSADYSQIELVVLAHLSKDKALTEAFNNGIDIHAKTASAIFGTTIDKVTSDMRRIAKVINFGVIYGMSTFRLSNELKIPRKDASTFIKSYFKIYAGVTKFLKNAITFTEENGYAETITGRRRYIPEINNRNKIVKKAAERIAINTPVQGSASDIVKIAMIKMDKIIKTENLDAKLLLQVHDEIIFSCAEKDIEKLKNLTKKTMEQAVKLSVPLKVSIETGKSWGELN